MTGERVTVDNFVRAETDRMFATLCAQAGGVNRLMHNRTPTPLDNQPVIRMNRDTLYSLAVLDLASGAQLTVPDARGRYLSVMVVNQDHYINRITHDPGSYDLTVDEFDTRYVLAGIRCSSTPTMRKTSRPWPRSRMASRSEPVPRNRSWRATTTPRASTRCAARCSS